MIDISWHALQQWLHDGTQPSNYIFAAWLNRFVGCAEDLPQPFVSYDWSQSFGQPVVIFYDELITTRTLQTLHQHLRQQSCDIENIIVLTSHGLGVSDWWKNYVALYQDRSFTIQEWLFARSVAWQKYFINLKMPHRCRLGKNIKKFFNSYSGTNAKLDRQYLALKLRALGDMGVVDMMSDFTATKQQLIDHAYYLGYFKNCQEELLIGKLYDHYVQDSYLLLDPLISTISRPKVKDELFDCQGSQYHLDRLCLATVINETNNSEPWSMVSEKTLRPFWHHCAVIHPGYRSASHLEALGFWFPHDIIDYAYQDEPDWLSRINQMIESLKQSHDNLHGKYQEYWEDNYQHFRHNALLIKHYRDDPISRSGSA